MIRNSLWHMIVREISRINDPDNFYSYGENNEIFMPICIPGCL